MKYLIIDSSSIITLAMNNLLSLLVSLKRKFPGVFVISNEVKKEVVDNPIKMKKFELEALMISAMIKNEVITVMEAPRNEINRILETANSAFKARGESIRIMHEGEASCLALCNTLKSKNNEVALVIDERTTRMLCENPANLQKLFEKKLHTSIVMKQKNLEIFEGYNIIRSSELCFVAYKKGLISLPAHPREAIDALLYAAKFKGCSISSLEIEEAKNLV